MTRLQRLLRSSDAPPANGRSMSFRAREHGRYWWHRLADTDYVPSVYASLADDEWEVLDAWFRETDEKRLAGEINVPAMCLLQGLVSGGAIRRVVQLGHYSGYSSLLLGFMLRRMGVQNGLFSIDIDPTVTEFSRDWIARAGLAGQVTLHTGDSADPVSIEAALSTLGGPPQLILLDSSHQYAHTVVELDCWVPVMPVGGLMLLHDTSVFAEDWDSSREGGVHRALQSWLPSHPEVNAINLNAFVERDADVNALTYKDACGLGLVQKIGPSPRPLDQPIAASE
jgi:predicted O-methyltransferase YrrM